MAGHILVVDDEEGVRFSLRGILEDENYTVSEADSGENALLFLENNLVDLIFLDIWLTGIDGLETLKRAKELYPQIPFIMISGHGNVETAVQALRLGAHDFVEKPLSLEKILLSVRHALEMKELKQENSLLRQAVHNDYEVPMVANSKVMRAFMRDLMKVAPTDAWVLITGENGTGKELAARTLHRNSKQKDRPFIAVNCAAIPEELIESELFGHEKGAFTGADSTKIGKFELANNGILFLDEIGDMSLRTQAKILRILQEQCFERVGGTKNIKVQVRVIAATNKDLEKAIADGEFRQDLYYRLRVFPLSVPPLRERKEDMPLLIETLLHAVEKKYSMKAPVLTKEAVQVLEEWSWPGNVRELMHLLERLTVLYSGRQVDYVSLPLEMLENVGKGQTAQRMEDASATDKTLQKMLELDYKTAKSAFEEYYLTRKLEEAGGNVSRLSELIGLERSNIHKKLKNINE